MKAQKSSNKNIRIMLAGGGSGGSAAPLLAVARFLNEKHGNSNFKFCLVGTELGPERQMAELNKIEFYTLPTAKFRRYFSLQNLLLPFTLSASLIKAFFLIKRFKPHCVVGAGSFVQVPIAVVAKILGIPVVIHQQDVYPGLANKIISPFADKVTLTFKESEGNMVSAFTLEGLKGKGKYLLTGNPVYVQPSKLTREQALDYFGLDKIKPVVLILGGGTGALGINQLVWRALDDFLKIAQIIHVTGKGKNLGLSKQGYVQLEFLLRPEIAYEVSDFVVSRAGLSTITELSSFSKTSIIIPMPNSHQEINGKFLIDKGAAIVLEQKRIVPQGLVKMVRKLMFEPKSTSMLKKNIHSIMKHDGAEKVAEVILEVISNYNKSEASR